MTNSTKNGFKYAGLLLTIIILLGGMLITWGTLSSTVANQQGEIAKKVDRVEYKECIKRIDENVDDIKTEQGKMTDKLDEIILRLPERNN